AGGGTAYPGSFVPVIHRTFPGATAPDNTWGTTPVEQTVQPSNGAFSGPPTGNAGFYILGANPPGGFFPDNGNSSSPNIVTTHTTALMSYRVAVAQAPAPGGGAQPPPPAQIPGVNIVLRRLACPHMPLNNIAGSPAFNPYITVDTLELRGGTIG